MFSAACSAYFVCPAFRWLRSKTKTGCPAQLFYQPPALLLILIDLGQWSYNQLQQRSHPVLPAGTTACTHCDSPDIFLIACPTNMRAIAPLRDLFSFNDSAFTASWNSGGFRDAAAKCQQLQLHPLHRLYAEHGLSRPGPPGKNRCWPIAMKPSPTTNCWASSVIRATSYSTIPILIFPDSPPTPRRPSYPTAPA